MEAMADILNDFIERVSPKIWSRRGRYFMNDKADNLLKTDNVQESLIICKTLIEKGPPC